MLRLRHRNTFRGLRKVLHQPAKGQTQGVTRVEEKEKATFKGA